MRGILPCCRSLGLRLVQLFEPQPRRHLLRSFDRRMLSRHNRRLECRNSRVKMTRWRVVGHVARLHRLCQLCRGLYLVV